MKKGQSLWNYYHGENSWPIVHAFNSNNTDSIELSDTPILKQKLREIAEVEHNNHLRGGIVNIVGQSEISWMIAMRKLGYRYACMWFDGTWSASDDVNLKLLDEINRINEEFDITKWIVAGNILQTDDERYSHFERNIILINLDTWYEQGAQDPADVLYNQDPADRYSRQGTRHEKPSDNWVTRKQGIVEDFEDSLFGIVKLGGARLNIKHATWNTWITHEEFNEQYHHKLCNPLLTWSLRQELIVPGLSADFMNCLATMKPHVGSIEFEKAIQGLPFDSDKLTFQANRMIREMFAPDSPIYFVNTESSQPGIAEQIEGTVFDQYVGATAGFKLFYYAYKYGFTKDTKFVLYDFDPLSCKFKRDMLEQWDGINYPEFVDAWIEQHPDANGNLRDLTFERWPNVIQQFDGDTNWLSVWDRIRQSNWEVIECDLIYGHDKLFEAVENKRTLMWTSNIYSYIVPKMLSKPFAMELSFISLITKLNELHDDCWFSGTDINDNDLTCPSRAIISTTNNETLTFEQ